MHVAETMKRILSESFTPQRLAIIDDSHRHAGHAGARPEGETHFRVTMVAPGFAGMSRVDRSRRVHEALADELKGPVHALALSLKAPGEGA